MKNRFNIQWIKSFFLGLYYTLKVGLNYNNDSSHIEPDKPWPRE
jgi:hypothetical protein